MALTAPLNCKSFSGRLPNGGAQTSGIDRKEVSGAAPKPDGEAAP
jgi:hypothetical protein